MGYTKRKLPNFCTVKIPKECVDVFSRFVRVQPMKSKNSTDAVVAFKKMMRKKSMPAKVWVDQGTEFMEEILRQIHEKNGFQSQNVEHKN